MSNAQGAASAESQQLGSNVPTPAPTPAAGDPKIKPLNFSEGSGNTKVEKPLDSKANNWSLWAQDIYLIFDFMKAIGYVKGKICHS